MIRPPERTCVQSTARNRGLVLVPTPKQYRQPANAAWFVAISGPIRAVCGGLFLGLQNMGRGVPSILAGDPRGLGSEYTKSPYKGVKFDRCRQFWWPAHSPMKGPCCQLPRKPSRMCPQYPDRRRATMVRTLLSVRHPGERASAGMFITAAGGELSVMCHAFVDIHRPEVRTKPTLPSLPSKKKKKKKERKATEKALWRGRVLLGKVLGQSNPPVPGKIVSAVLAIRESTFRRHSSQRALLQRTRTPGAV
ncbi:hypothetical protein GQ53DRAFT_196301 [Thozetella sp. PMI_491]|nr:hypothetical protein GQ53DRAFT_196301 [Thozetella sp. PMI_491]